MTSPYETIGRPVGRAEGPAKVTGQAIFPADVNLPGTLVGKCLRSPFPYAKIVSIDQVALHPYNLVTIKIMIGSGRS